MHWKLLLDGEMEQQKGRVLQKAWRTLVNSGSLQESQEEAWAEVRVVEGREWQKGCS